MGTRPTKSGSVMLADVPAGSVPFTNDVEARKRAKVGREPLAPGIGEKTDDRFGIPRLRQEDAPSIDAPQQPAATQNGEAGRLIRGQLVEVKSAQEIAATLDDDGKLAGIPFMPEMAVHCGQRFRVFRRADFTCVEGQGLRSLDDTVFLEDVRCDGSAHDGCQRRCLIFWKQAWLKSVDISDSSAAQQKQSERTTAAALHNLPTRKGNRYLCQSTALAAATTNLPSWNLVPFLRQIRDGELTVRRFLSIVTLALLNLLRGALGLQEIGRLSGAKSTSSKTDLRLQPGEWVRIKSHDQIRQTLDPASRNRGLKFEPEMSEYCGQLFQMGFPVQRMIHEETGEMITVRNTVALKNLTCHGLCAKSCPRNNYWFWREDWLERTSDPRRR
jgi:hypothetical protein